MKNCILFALVALPLVTTAANAGGHGGPNRTFDPTSYGGNWSCFGPTGSCGAGTFANSFDAVGCGGGTADMTARSNFINYGNAQGAALVKLMIPKICNFSLANTNNSLVCFNETYPGSTPIQNSLIWGYGAHIDRMQIGGNGFIPNQPGGYNPTLDGQGFSSAYINTVSAGTSQVVVNDGHQAIFSAGKWIKVTGIAGQNNGFAPSHQINEFAFITNVSGSTITLASPLTYSYNQLWPQVGSSPSPGQGGPAAIYLMDPCWNINVTYLGLTLTTDASIQNNMTGRNVAIQDMAVPNNGPGTLQYGWIINTIVNSLEVDKESDFLYMSGVVQKNANGGNLVQSQSVSTTNLTIENSIFENNVNGFPGNTIVRGSKFGGQLQVGTLGEGVAVSFAIYNSTYGTGATTTQHIPKTQFSGYDGAGNFTISVDNLGGNPAGFAGIFAPGHKYFFSDSSGNFFFCSPQTSFVVNSLVQSGSTVTINITPSWGAGALPTPTCANEGSIPYTNYSNYALVTYTENSATTGGTPLPSIGGLAP